MKGCDWKKAGFVEKLGLDPADMNAELFIKSFMDEMGRGIEGKHSSLGMIPTYLSCDGALPKGRYAAAIDAGGTNFRTALIGFSDNGVSIERFSSQPMPGTKGGVTWKDFIVFVSKQVKPLLKYTDHIGICISFPTTITPERDGIIQHFTKEVDIAGFEGRYICRDLLDELGTRNTKATVLNDTSAVLLSGLAAGAKAEGLIGLINGTGTNTCCQLGQGRLGLAETGSMIVDIESGGFCPPERSAVDIALDHAAAAPGVYQEEKIVSGAYLGEICRLAMKEAAADGLFSQRTAENIRALNEFATPAADAFGAGAAENALFASPQDAALARELVRAVFSRAAKHIACTLTAILRFCEHAPGQQVTVSADGSVFRQSALFRPALESYMARYASIYPVRFVEMDNSTIIGTAIGALMNENY